ncbi:MAG: hypothetical protein MK108_19195, partial [Mariniblastus sp.]|nr:hypothetical protein [Mariniblastus sp.]
HQPGEPAGPCIRGNGKQNVQSLFLTPSGEIFHVATGFLSPEDLLAEAEFALHLFQELKQDGQDDRERVIDAHQQRMESAGFSPAEIANSNPLTQVMGQMSNFANGNLATGRPIQSPTGAGQIFAAMIRRQFLQDQLFTIEHPLMSWQQLERDPTSLVGNGQSFFSSSSSGSQR